jgi:SAM-dependent methyltransferase
MRAVILKAYWLLLASMSRILRRPQFARRQRLVIRKGILEYQQQEFFRFHNVTSYKLAFRREATKIAGESPSVLDLGGGDGSNFDLLFEGIHGFPGHYTILDVIEKPNTPNVLVGDACKPIATERRFDVTFSHNALEHMPEPFAVAQNMFDLLRPGGLTMAKTVFACHHHASPSDYWRFTDEGLRYIFEKAGFETIEYGYDVAERRREKMGGHIPQSMPLIDSRGGWWERWHVFYIGRRLE